MSLSNFVAAQKKALKRGHGEEDEEEVKELRKRQRANEMEDSEDEDEEWRLTEKQLAALRSSEQLVPQLRDERLQALVRKIDSAVDRPRALEEAVRQDPRFAEFYQQLLLQLQIAEVRSDGHLVSMVESS